MSQQTSHLNIINPENLYNPQPFGYSHVVEVQHFRRIIHIAGQGGENRQGNLSKDFSRQVLQAFYNLKIALDSVDATLQNIAMLRVLIVHHDEDKHHILVQTMRQLWPDQKFPACTLIPVSRLAIPNMLFEVEATAYLN
ncbi:RidA family protein [Acinetobacter sp. S40]|uniref:RidA family protein n=1 Tax=Acinetobacter sp. S40 TaxID=2767434 RepID=UPI0019095C4D|nr:RidA family protein [Acinetobacter sp. S40]MBJ9985611.1 RidA family protein [Acinetobacter sp. S40]